MHKLIHQNYKVAHIAHCGIVNVEDVTCYRICSKFLFFL